MYRLKLEAPLIGYESQNGWAITCIVYHGLPVYHVYHGIPCIPCIILWYTNLVFLFSVFAAAMVKRGCTDQVNGCGHLGGGLGGTLADFCLTARSKNCILASNLQARQQGFAFQQSYSSEQFSPRLQILNRRQPYSMV